ncbi:putative transmembrane protein [Raphanus sativus]|nr:putative transmembrane protein [Raphanus sativus]
MVSMLLLHGSESLLLLPPPPEPLPFVFLLDLLTGVSAPDPPDPPDASETLALDLSSFLCHCFTLAAASTRLSYLSMRILCFLSVIVLLIMKLLARHLFCLHLPQYEVHLPQYEAHLPQHETCLSGRGGSCNSTAHYGCRFPHNSKAHQDGA